MGGSAPVCLLSPLLFAEREFSFVITAELIDRRAP